MIKQYYKDFINEYFIFENRKQTISLYVDNNSVIGLQSGKHIICADSENYLRNVRRIDKRMRGWIMNKLIENNLSTRFIMSLDRPERVGNGVRGTFFDFELVWQNIHGKDLQAHIPLSKEIITQLQKELKTLE